MAMETKKKRKRERKKKRRRRRKKKTSEERPMAFKIHMLSPNSKRFAQLCAFVRCAELIENNLREKGLKC